MSFFDITARFRYKSLLRCFRRQFKRLDFDTEKIDTRIAQLAEDIYKRYRAQFAAVSEDRPLVAYIATELYSNGGHTPCVVNLAESMVGQKGGQVLFLSRVQKTEAGVPSIIQRLRTVMGLVTGVNDSVTTVVQNTIALYNQIVSFAPQNLVIFIHQNDILSAMVLHLLRRYTDINLLFWNHASHFPNVGMHFAHCILEGTPTTRRITEERRRLHNCRLIGLQSKSAQEIQYYPEERKAAGRAQFGVPEGGLLTVSGGNARKFFAPNDESEYFNMILELLRELPQLRHIVMMSSKGNRELKAIERIFAAYPEERSRLLLLQPSSEYQYIFQCSDLYIDSVPIGSAMTQIDCMCNKVPTVVYINRKSPEHTFHEYMSPDYAYMYDNVSDMKQGILRLLRNPEMRAAAVEQNYQYWLTHYERNAVVNKYLAIFDSLRHDR